MVVEFLRVSHKRVPLLDSCKQLYHLRTYQELRTMPNVRPVDCTSRIECCGAVTLNHGRAASGINSRWLRALMCPMCMVVILGEVWVSFASAARVNFCHAYKCCCALGLQWALVHTPFSRPPMPPSETLTAHPAAWRWLSSVTPIGYAFEALLINEFSDADGTRPYRIEASVSYRHLSG